MPLDSLSLRSRQSSSSTYKGSFFSDENKFSNNTVLYSELRLIERNDGEINVCWKGAHMMLFFMAFVFGSLCTCSFHRLMSMFDQKCVLFPKVVSHHSIHRIVYEFFSFKPSSRNSDEFSMSNEPTDYVSTQWADSSVCYLPTFVPLVSGLAGLVWTTMFLMCSSGTSNVTGAQRHWRALPAIFFFSITMSVLCIYSSCVTHSGLQVLCMKMAEATGSASYSYNINVATLVYERRIRGVYQATRLCIMAAWLHTSCWVVSTLLVAARVLLAVDFTLVRVKAQLVGNLDDILQKHEKQIDSFNAESATPLRFDIDEDDSEVELFSTSNTIKGHKKSPLDLPKEPTQRFESAQPPTSLSPEGRQEILDKYMHRILHDLLTTVGKRDRSTQTKTHLNTNTPEEITGAGHTETLAKEFIKKLRGKLTKEINDFEHQIKSSLENKGINTEDNFEKVDDDRKKYEVTDKELKNKINHIQYRQIEQGGTISSREIYAINLEQGTGEKTKGKDKETEEKDNLNRFEKRMVLCRCFDQLGEGTAVPPEKSEITQDRDMSVEILNVEYSNKSYNDLKILEKATKTNKDEKEHEKKDEEIELKDSKNKENVHNAEQLHISDDPDNSDNNNKSGLAKAYDKTDTNLQKEETNDDDTKDGKESQDTKDNHNKNKEM